jgi:hypothetical protein
LVGTKVAYKVGIFSSKTREWRFSHTKSTCFNWLCYFINYNHGFFFQFGDVVEVVLNHKII